MPSEGVSAPIVAWSREALFSVMKQNVGVLTGVHQELTYI